MAYTCISQKTTFLHSGVCLNNRRDDLTVLQGHQRIEFSPRTRGDMDVFFYSFQAQA